jgi:hypothetical protein
VSPNANQWRKKAIGLLMDKWEESFNHMTADARYPTSVDGDKFYTTSKLSKSEVKDIIKSHWGENTLLLEIGTYGTAVMLRIAEWSINLARKIFSSETEFTANPSEAIIRSIYQLKWNRPLHL